MAENRKKKTASEPEKITQKDKDTLRQARLKERLALEEQFRIEVRLWLIIGVSLVLELSNFGLGGAVGNVLGNFLKGMLGWMAFLAPVIFIVTSFYTAYHKGNELGGQKVIGILLLVLFTSMFLALFSYGSSAPKPGEAYLNAYRSKELGGGFLGGFLAWLLVNGFSIYGAWILDITMLIISLVLISGKSALRGIRSTSERAASSVLDTGNTVRENVTARKEERELTRREHKAVRGRSLPKEDPDEILLHAYDTAEEETYPPREPEIKHRKDPFLLNKEDFDQTAVSSKGRRDIYKISDDHGMRELTADGMDDPSDEKSEVLDLSQAVADITPEPLAESQNDDFPMTPVGPTAAPAARGKRRTYASPEEQAAGLEEIRVQQQAVVPAEKKYVFPTTALLTNVSGKGNKSPQKQAAETAEKLEETFDIFGVEANVIDYSCGPAVTRFHVQPGRGVKVSRIVSLSDDIKLALAASDIRIEAPVPGESYIGIEVPNQESSVVSFRRMMESPEFKDHKSKLAFALGMDLAGKTIVSDIARMPHLLIAGATGSGKSVCINTIIMSILYKADPSEVKLILIDPKVVELSVYNGIPHLLIPVVTDSKKASTALLWAVNEMTDRYQKFASCQVRDLKGYNEYVRKLTPEERGAELKVLPQLVVIVDELADLMMVAQKEVEEYICRLAQLARACGIHLVIATQRPSVNVITGLIKANMPSRIAFAVTSGVDSRTILDMNGAEKLLGKGDMLYDPQGSPKPQRVQGAYVSDEDVKKVVDFIKKQNGVAVDQDIVKKFESLSSQSGMANTIGSADTLEDGRDSYFVEAGKIIVDKDKASIGMLQRYLKIGFNRAARIMDQLEEAGVVGPEEGTKPRTVLMSMEQFENYLEENG